MATVILTVNGTDLSGLGAYVTAAPGIFGGPDRQIGTAAILGRAGAFLLSPSVMAPRRLVLKGFIDPTARTVAALQSALQQVRDVFYQGYLTVASTDTAGTVRQISGLLQSFESDVRLGRLHFQSAQVADFTATILCDDPFWREVQPFFVGAPTAGTRYSIPLGTAPSSPIINVMGSATNPVVTYRDGWGNAVWTITATITLAATNDWLSFNCQTGRVTKYVSGTATSVYDVITAGQTDFPRPFDPQDGDVTTSQQPTIETSAGSLEALYYKRYL